MASWVPLHVHSQYSILRSTASIDALVERATALQLPALALTDEGNLHGAVDFYKACKAAKLKPIIGCKLQVAPTSRHEKKKLPGQPAGYPLILLAKDEEGYRNLCRLSSFASLEGFYYTPRIDRELIERFHHGLICLTGMVDGRVGQLILKGDDSFREEVSFLQEQFKDDFYSQVERHRMKEDELRETWVLERYKTRVEEEEKIIATLRTLGMPLVATHEIRYMEQDDWRAHEILMNIQTGEPCVIHEKDSRGNFKQKISNPRREILSTHSHHFPSPQAIAELFSDMPEAVTESVRLAEKCSFAFDFSKRYYPAFVPPYLAGKSYTKEERQRESENYLKQRCEEEIPRRYTQAELEKVQEKFPSRDPLDVVRERLNYELNVILTKGMCDYLLIVYDFIAWAKKKGIAVGPGRGSGAGSIILYLLAITDIEPIRFNLFFERFINPERPSYPDIDVDICMDRREEVIDYTLMTYGKERVAHIITFGTMKAKMAIRDVGRMLGIDLPKVNAIAKLVPEDLNMTLERALEIDPDLRAHYEADMEVKELIDLSKRLEGSVRNTSIHAAGLIISDDPLIDRIPLGLAKESNMAVTQYAMKPVEYVGMLKIDFLGLKTLTSIQHCIDAVNRRRGSKIDWMRLPLEDTAAFSIVNEGRTLGIFQLESSPFSTDLARQVHIDCFEEMIAVNALIRPGPREMSPSYIARKHKREAIVSDHPLLEDILKETYGIIVYQEQVMQIASRLAGYSLGEGDVLRRAMGKKDKEEMAGQREKFKNGAKKQGIEESIAVQIFDKMEKFASYGFNKSHAAAYGYLTYATSYLKAHFPSDWMAALLTSDRDDLDKVSKIIRECQSMRVIILPPDINESDRVFLATAGGIRFALTAVKGVGEGVVESILSERRQSGAFRSLDDFLKRMRKAKLGRRPVELLIEVGCFDFTGWRREALLAHLPSLAHEIEKRGEEREGGILLLSFMEGESEEKLKEPPQVPEPPKLERMKRERELLGFYLTGHPLESFTQEIESLGCKPIPELIAGADGTAALAAFLVEAVEVRLASKTQRKFARLVISDGGERYELMVWPDHFERWGKLLAEGQPLVAVLSLEKQEGETRLLCHWLAALSELPPDAREASQDVLKRTHGRVRRFKKPAVAPPSAPPESGPTQRLILEVEAQALRLSHILVLKKLFRSSHGELPVRLILLEGERRVASLQIPSKWGVKMSRELEEKLRKLPGLIRLQVAADDR